MFNYDVIVILWGWRYNDGALTELSIQRLDKWYEAYNKGKASKIITLWSRYSTYSPNAIEFAYTWAQLRKDYLVNLWIDKDNILTVEGWRDTICEAFASREEVKCNWFKRVLLVTSDDHMERALWIFRRVYGKEILIDWEKVDSGNILIPEEEMEYFKLTKEFFNSFPEDIGFPNLLTWFNDNKELYIWFKSIHDKYHPPWKESQAYAWVVR